MSSHDTMVRDLPDHALRGIIRDLSKQTWPEDWTKPRIAAAQRELRRHEEQDKEATTEHDHD